MPIATVYPPGALVVELQVHPINTTFNVSVFHANDYLYDTNPDALSDISCTSNNYTYEPLKDLAEYQPERNISSLLRTCVSEW